MLSMEEKAQGDDLCAAVFWPGMKPSPCVDLRHIMGSALKKNPNLRNYMR